MKHNKMILIIDGQGGKIGSQLLGELHDRLSATNLSVTLFAVGTNAIATSNMLKCNPDEAATGENPVIVGCRTADIITGPVGIAVADSLNGEVTPDMARAVGQSAATRVLIPVNRCHTVIAGVSDISFSALIREAADTMVRLLAE